MLYLEHFIFPTGDQEFDYLMGIKRQCYTSFYPFKLLSAIGFERMDFEPITILYGGNGSGKTTAINIIAEKLSLLRDSRFNKSSFFDPYVRLCQEDLVEALPAHSRMITSDDVFDYILNIRMMNEGIDGKRETLFDECLEAKYAKFQMKSLDDYERLKQVNQSRRLTQSMYVKENLMSNVREHSNGENAFRYFTEKIGEDGLYILDEPENSLSPERQLELVRFLTESVRFFGCQFIIATHSPFILSIPGAKIYDLDQNPVDVRHWTELSNVRVYYEFFNRHKNQF